MPNYNITVTEGYTPYTFDEMIKPLQIYKAEYDKMDAEIQDIIVLFPTLGSPTF